MDADTARLILYMITAAAAVAWLLGLQFLLTARRARRIASRETIDQFQLTDSMPDNFVFGGAEVAGTPAELSARAASVLAKESIGQVGFLKISEQTGDQVAFEKTGHMFGQSSGSMFPWSWICRGRLRFTSLNQERTQVDYAIETSGGFWLLWLGGLFQVLGLVALVVGFWLINTYVVSNPNLGVRGQVWQMLQVVHFLWPPFMFGARYRSGSRMIQAKFDALVHNLPYYRD